MLWILKFVVVEGLINQNQIQKSNKFATNELQRRILGFTTCFPKSLFICSTIMRSHRLGMSLQLVPSKILRFGSWCNETADPPPLKLILSYNVLDKALYNYIIFYLFDKFAKKYLNLYF